MGGAAGALALQCGLCRASLRQPCQTCPAGPNHPLSPLMPLTLSPPHPSPSTHAVRCRRCYEVRCDPRSVVTDGYGNSFDRSGVCKHPGATVVVRTVDNCERGQSMQWCCSGCISQLGVQGSTIAICIDAQPTCTHRCLHVNPLHPPCRPLQLPRQRLLQQALVRLGGVCVGSAGTCLKRTAAAANLPSQPLPDHHPPDHALPRPAPPRPAGAAATTAAPRAPTSTCPSGGCCWLVGWVVERGRGWVLAGQGCACPPPCPPSAATRYCPSLSRSLTAPPSTLQRPPTFPAGRLRSWLMWPRAWPPSSSAACPAPTPPPTPPPTAPPACRPPSSPLPWATAAMPTTHPPTLPPSPWSCASTTLARSRVS